MESLRNCWTTLRRAVPMLPRSHEQFSMLLVILQIEVNPIYHTFILLKTKWNVVPLFMLHTVTAGNGKLSIDVLRASNVTITGVADHLSYTFDMKYTERSRTDTTDNRKNMLSIENKKISMKRWNHSIISWFWSISWLFLIIFFLGNLFLNNFLAFSPIISWFWILW